VITGIILAAGASSRIGSPKALLTFEGETFLDRLIRTFSPVCDPVVVVLGNHREEILSGIAPKHQAVFVVNDRPELGMLSSLQRGLNAVPEGASGVMFSPVDYPAIQESTLRILAGRFASEMPPLALPEYRGKHGHPVCLSPALASEIRALPPGAQARDVVRAHISEALIVNVDDPGVVTDVDTLSDYEALSRLAMENAR
jgi:CTP:molybdopterin cytidylyltransferase MocA